MLSRTMFLVRNGGKTAVRWAHSSSARPTYSGTPLEGCLFTPLNKAATKLTYPHPLDDPNEFKRFLREELPEECGDCVPEIVPFTNRIKEMLKYTIPSFNVFWTFGPEFMYRVLVPKDKQTPENLRKAKLLRACVEMTFASSAVSDDIVDGSDVRRDKPAWKLACPDGLPMAYGDAFILENLPFHVIRKHFKGTPGYYIMLESLAMGNLGLYLGQSLDVFAQKSTIPLSKNVTANIVDHKAGRLVAVHPVLGMVHAGILDERLIATTEKIFNIFGTLIQTWDDFCDYYCTPKQTGKPLCDFQNAGSTWASTTALDHFTEKQKKVFYECYGSADSMMLETVKGLYDSIDLPSLYIAHARNRANQSLRLIETLQHPDLENACKTFLRWLVDERLWDTK